ncbi:hypothetical protein LWI29_007711 [Acer saccharum]|uniref:Uncharacterized protein n=1 Tax=Acer saccharum TaxID=4024 RepID=A0AA39W4Z3_ACESA|nr:hypothetical protein LWI29_007711 [Acer saccharum]
MMRDRERGTRSNPSASCRLQLLVFCFDSTPPPSVHNGAVNGGRPSLVDARVCRPPLTLKMSTSYVPRNSSDSICTPSTNTVETENDQAPLLKVKCHLLKIKGCGIASCSKVTNANLLEMQRVVEEAELKVKQSLSWPVPLSSTVGSSSASASTVFGSDPKKRKRVSAVIEKAFNICA